MTTGETPLSSKTLRHYERLARDFLGLVARGTSGRVIGICGAQGSGKTTATRFFRQELELAGLRVAWLSLDDLYLTRRERRHLGANIHPLLTTRGPPGTHDVNLGLTLIDQLLDARVTRIPRFDKSRDDRRPVDQWDPFLGPADVILFEGWCVGAAAQDDEAVTIPINALERERDPNCLWRKYVNAALAGSYQTLFRRIDHLTLFLPPSFDVVTGWRRQQEKELRTACALGRGGGSHRMNDAQIETFVQYYERLTRHMIAEMPARADCVIRLEPNREVRDMKSNARAMKYRPQP